MKRDEHELFWAGLRPDVKQETREKKHACNSFKACQFDLAVKDCFHLAEVKSDLNLPLIPVSESRTD